MSKIIVVALIALSSLFSTSALSKEAEIKIDKKLEATEKKSSEITRRWILGTSSYKIVTPLMDTDSDTLNVGNILNFSYGFHKKLGASFSTENQITLGFGASSIDELDEKNASTSENLEIQGTSEIYTIGISKQYAYNLNTGFLGLTASPFIGAGFNYNSISLTNNRIFDGIGNFKSTIKNNHFSILGKAGISLSHRSGLLLQALYSYHKPLNENAELERSTGDTSETFDISTGFDSFEIVTLGIGYQY